MQNQPKSKKNSIATLLSMAMIISLITACSLKRPEAAKPLESIDGAKKSFFAEQVINPKTGKIEWKGKKFMCGWASVDEIGEYSKQYTDNNVIQAWHCNVVFTFNQDHSKLIGKLVNPSYPDNMEKWTTALEIPIKRNYAREYKKDEYQNQTNEIVENETKDHASARPLMDLDLESVLIKELYYQESVIDSRTQNVSDIEFDEANSFFAFTVHYTSSTTSFGNLFETKIRYNFLEMKTNEKFESTPWHVKNANHLNALHIADRKIEGASVASFAAHWDKYKSRNVYLIGFPKKYYDIAVEALHDYNKIFREQISTKDHPITHDLFIPVNGDHLKYTFDLRYTSIKWIDDYEKSLNAPLGIGTALADRLTGEILWGGVTLWGGMIDYIIKSSAPNLDFSTSSLPSSNGLNWLGMINGNAFSFQHQFDFPVTLDSKIAPDFFNSFIESYNNKFDLIYDNDGKKVKNDLELSSINQKEEVIDFLKDQATWLKNYHNSALRDYHEFNFNKYFRNVLKPYDELENNNLPSQNQSKETLKHNLEMAKRRLNSSVCVITTEDVYADLMMAKENTNFDPEKVMKAFVKDLILHEFGHMIGLGHNMAENILPTVSAVMELNLNVPKVNKQNEEYKDLDTIKKIMQSEKTKYTVPKKYWEPMVKMAKENMTNYSTVMGYKNSKTDMFYNDHTKLIPGPSDVQVLRYLYNQEYATYKYGDDDFTYYKVPATGQIPLMAPANIKDREDRFVSYFPSCTDFEATFDTSPLCKRWDRGYNEMTLASEYLASIDSLRDSKLIAKSELKGARSVWRMENYLWGYNLETMGKLRTFYDYMRDIFSDQIESISQDVDAVKHFSSACTKPSDQIENATLKELFVNNPKLKELCQVNKMIVEKLGSYMAKSGRDFTKIDYKNKTTWGGMHFGDGTPNYSQNFGTYQILTDLPFKLSALNTLTLTQPYAYLYGWMLEMDNYSHEKGGYLYSSLYPSEFTSAIKNAVLNNLQFGINGEKTKLKRTALSLGYFLQRGSWNRANDKFRFPKPTFLRKISDQTLFQMSYVAVLLTAVKMEGANAPANRYSSFTGKILDIYSGKESPAGEVFILPDGSILVKGAANTIINPFTKIQFYSDTEAFVWAYKISFDSDDNESLSSESVKNIFPTMVNNALDSCINGINGEQNGLKHFFNKSANPNVVELEKDTKEYIGFKILPGIARSLAFQNDFKKSIEENYQRFINHFPGHAQIETTCFEALNGIGLTSASAGAINGYWMPGMSEYIEE